MRKVKPVLLTYFCLVLASLAASAQVTPERLLAANDEPQNWLTYSGNYAGHRYSRLDQIDTSNVARLAPAWVFQTGVLGKFETTPLVVDGVMYATGEDNYAWALDPRNGRPIWTYRRELPDDVRACCGKVNRGFGILADKLYLGTLDAHVVALDTKTGSVLWDVESESYQRGHSFTLAPLVVKDKVILGVAGGEYGVRGYIDAFDADTGEQAWRFYIIPGPGEPGHDTWEGDSWMRGGAPAWITGTYDPDLGLTYWGTGNPGPDAYGDDREGDNLYSDSLVALDVDTGELRWHFQYTPHDVHDWDAVQIPVLVDMDWNGEPRKLLLHANRNGFFYVLDRTDGEFLLAKPFSKVTWSEEFTAEGRPIVLPDTAPTSDGNYACPGVAGATNWMSPSWSPQTGLLYVPAREQCDIYFSSPQPFREGFVYWGSSFQPPSNEKPWGAVRAIDPRTGNVEWEFKHHSAPWAGNLATAGGLVFTGDMEGYLIALDARTGKELWNFPTGSAIYSNPMSYEIDGRQYVVISSGSSLTAFALPEVGDPAERPQPAPAPAP